MLGVRLAVRIISSPLEEQSAFIDAELDGFQSLIARLADYERNAGGGSHAARARASLKCAESAAAKAKALLEEISPSESVS